jgi:tRNA-dihydrouridine synthase
MNFWTTLPKAFFALAPMEDVSDTVFRELVASTAAPGRLHVLFTEFLSVDGFLHEKGSEKVSHRLFVSPQERDILKAKGIRLVAQIWGSDPEKFFEASRRIAEQFEFDGIDINMGCPVKKIVKHNACSALIKTPELAKEIVVATREGSALPVSVKTRIGFNEVETERWIANLLEVSPAAITVHGRTQKMQSDGTADWNEVLRSVRLRDSKKAKTLILGNGDVSDYDDGLDKAASFQADGIMVGSGIFANPAFFADPQILDPTERIQLLRKHITRFGETWDGKKNYAILKRFFKIYVHSFENAGDLRALLMNTHNFREGLEVLDSL